MVKVVLLVRKLKTIRREFYKKFPFIRGIFHSKKLPFSMQIESTQKQIEKLKSTIKDLNVTSITILLRNCGHFQINKVPNSFFFEKCKFICI